MRFTTQIQIRSAFETGPDGSLHHANVVRIALQAGYLVTDALGMTADFFAANGTTIILRGVHVEFESLTRDNEMLTLTTWLTNVRRFRGLRQLQLTSAEDGRTIANMRLDWVYLNLKTLAPARFAPEMLTRSGDETEGACKQDWTIGVLMGEPHATTRVVQHHEIDLNKHVNTAIYVEWLEQAWCEATGQTPATLAGHHIEFLRSAVVGDGVIIETQPCGPNLWQQEIKHITTNDVLVTNVCASTLA